VRFHSDRADERALSESADVHGEGAPINGIAAERCQGQRATPQRDGALVAQELVCAQSRRVLVSTDATLDALPFERIEIAAVDGRTDHDPHAAERAGKVGSSHPAGIDAGIPRLRHGESWTEMGRERPRSSHRATMSGSPTVALRLSTGR
jgi:hypothetical protein